MDWVTDWVTKDSAWNIPAGGILDKKEEQGIAYLRCANGSIRIQAFSPEILRITFMRAGSPLPSRAVILEPQGAVRFPEKEDKPVLRLEAGNFTCAINTDTGGFEVLAGGASLLECGKGFILDRDRIGISTPLPRGVNCYGLGEKTGFLDKRGRRYTMWNTDEPHHLPDRDPLYQSIPFLIRYDGQTTSGLFLDSTARSSFDLGFTDEEIMNVEVFDDCMDLYILDPAPQQDSVSDASGPARAVELWTGLTGRMSLPPRWALGFQQCRWSYYPEEKVLEIAQGFRSRRIPCDVIYLDIDYMDGYRVFTWNRRRFPDPAAMSEKLKAMGFRLVTIVDPGVKRDAEYKVYVDGAQQGLFCKLPGGEIYHGKVWPGDAAYPDFSSAKTREWWAGLHAALFDAGVDGIWNDMNEPSDFAPESNGDRMLVTVPSTVMMDEDGSPRSFARGHNAYALDMARSTVSAFSQLKPGTRPFVLTRAGYAGIQRYAAVWTGDNHSWWEHLASGLPMLLNLGMSGVAFAGGDAGGFQGNADAELYARWMQFAAFTPFFRAHSSIHSKAHEPWSFGSEAEAIAKQYIILRYRLLPYIYSELRRSCETGRPFMRALVLDWPEDPETRRLSDQYMFGSSILVAPIQAPAKTRRLVYLPKGTWYDFHTKAMLTGGGYVVAEAPLDRLPLFVKAGAIIPMAEAADHTGAMDLSNLDIEVYPGASGSFDLYEDDGESLAYLRGEYNLTRYTLTEEGPPEPSDPKKGSSKAAAGMESQTRGARLDVTVLHRGWHGGCANPNIITVNRFVRGAQQ